ncbi:MAG TPA: YoaK family protein [Bryobacteraceae bacterium]|nr:YoaK family protein [Bryobacteraceae bacterium]
MPANGERRFGGLRPSEVSEALLLTLIAGFIDAVGFLRLGGIYIANMSGNSVAIGIHSASGVWAEAGERCLPVVFYVAGLIVSRTMIHAERERRLEKVSVSPLILEMILLFLFIRVAPRNLAIGLGAFAMGVQAAAITRFNQIPVHTAFVTGSLVKMADRLVAGTREKDPVERKLAFQQSTWFLGLWIAYVLGAIGGAGAFQNRGVSVVYWTFPLLAALAAFHLFRREGG